MTDNVYEMLWDCEYCGKKKLLGQSHRFCPACGGPQNPEKRYFPADDEKVLAKDHEYAGADRLCPFCKNPVSAKMKFCASCGGPMEGAASVKLVQDGPAAAPAARSASGGLWWKAGLGLIGAAVLLVVAARTITKSVSLSVSGREWSRKIDVERYEAVSESAWCDQMPAGAFGISRAREVRSHREVADGQDCRKTRKDQGDGTYRETKECTTRYRSEPVYADKCSYSVTKWHVVRTERADGRSAAQEPAWPDVRIKEGDCLGCERLGTRREEYTVRFDAAGKAMECSFPDQAAWGRFADGSRWKGRARLTGGLVCDALAAE